MAKGLTLQELQSMGAKPQGFTLEQLKGQEPNHLDGFAAIDGRDFIQKSAEFIKEHNLPGAQLGEAVGTSLYDLASAAGKLFKGDLKGARDAVRGPGPDMGKVVGDTVRTVATPASIAFGNGGTFTSQILTNMGLGAAISGGAAAAEGGDPEEVARSTALGGAFGGALPVAGKGLAALGNQIDNIPSRFIESALGRSKAEVLQEIRTGKDPLADYVLTRKPIGTAETLVNGSHEAIDRLSGEIGTKLAQASRASGAKVTIGRDNFLDELAGLPEAQGALLNRADVRGIIERLAPQAKRLLQKPSWTLEEANSLRQLLDGTVGDRGFLSTQLSLDKGILKSSANSLRETVKSKAPAETRALFADLSNEIKLRDALLDKLAKKAGNQVLSFGDFIGGGLGGIFGGGLPGAAAGIATRRVIESVPFKISAAKAVNALTKAGPVLEDLAPAQKTALLTLFAELFAPDAEESQLASPNQ